MDILQLSDWAEELKRANDQFNKAYLARVEEKSQTVQTSTTLELRQTAINSYRDLCKNIEARATLSTGVYDGLINQLNVLTTKYNQLVDSRKSASQKKATV